MALILLIETSTNNCSVALARNKEVLAIKELLHEQYVHAEMLHTFIQEILESAQVHISQLDAVAVAQGPGSYTGLRIGVSAAKGLAFAGNIPLIAINSLQALAEYARLKWPSYQWYQPMLDARRDEVYTEVYNQQLECEQAVHPVIISGEYIKKFDGTPSLFIGDGAHKCKPWATSEHAIVGIAPSAYMMASIAFTKFEQGKFENLAYFEPYYLKDFIPGIAKKAVL